MNTSIECFPCLTRQIVATVRQFWSDPAEQEETARYLLRLLADQDMKQSPPELVSHIQRAVRVRLGNPDPFRTLKSESNAMAMEWCSELREKIAGSENAFDTAVRIAVAGNIIDFGIKGHVEPESVRRCIQDALQADIDAEAIDRLESRASAAKTILYLADNAGEIAFDKLLIELIGPGKVTVVVKGYPILNDVTAEDAVQVGLADMVRVVDNGSDIPGTVLERCSPDFRALVDSADLIISKGQGNFETLSEVSRPVSFIFMAKCPLVARRLSLPEGSFVVLNK